MPWSEPPQVEGIIYGRFSLTSWAECRGFKPPTSGKKSKKKSAPLLDALCKGPTMTSELPELWSEAPRGKKRTKTDDLIQPVGRLPWLEPSHVGG